MRFLARLHLIWILIALLAAFVVFANCIADVGGSEQAIPQPTRTVAPLISPAATE